MQVCNPGYAVMMAARRYIRTSCALLALLVPAFASASRAELQGHWLQLKSDRDKGQLTPAGQEVMAHYVPIRDDPDLQCKPPSLTNVIGIPDPPFEILLHDDSVDINYEYMDVREHVPLSSTLRPEDAPYTDPQYPHLGRAVGHYDGDTLVVETADPEKGYLDTLRVTYPQSNQMRSVARFTANGDRMHVEITHTDPLYYEAPFTMRFDFMRVDLDILEFGCTVDAASYEDRLEESDQTAH